MHDDDHNDDDHDNDAENALLRFMQKLFVFRLELPEIMLNLRLHACQHCKSN